MSQQEQFDRAVNVLVRAYLNHTLEHGSCTRCAVGNLVGAIAYPGSTESTGKRRGMEYVLANGQIIDASWYSVMGNNDDFWLNKSDIKLGEEQRAAIGYTWEQTAKIEQAFENTKHNPVPMYDGMMAVVKVLATIHEIDLNHTRQAKGLFVDASVA